MNKFKFITPLIVLFIVAIAVLYTRFSPKSLHTTNNSIPKQTNYGGPVNEPNLLSIEYMRKQEYPGSDITIEQTLPDGFRNSIYI